MSGAAFYGGGKAVDALQGSVQRISYDLEFDDNRITNARIPLNLQFFGGNNGSNSQKVLGGSFKDVSATKGINEVAHHFPQNKYITSILKMARNKGSAVLMT